MAVEALPFFPILELFSLPKDAACVVKTLAQ